MAWDQIPRDPEQQDGFDAIGDLIRRRRLWLGWTQRYLEMRSGVDQTVISRIENGKQYGLRWSRFATLVGSMGGLDVPARAVMQPANPSGRFTTPSEAMGRPSDRSTGRWPEVTNLETGVIDLGSGDIYADSDFNDA